MTPNIQRAPSVRDKIEKQMARTPHAALFLTR